MEETRMKISVKSSFIPYTVHVETEGEHEHLLNILERSSAEQAEHLKRQVSKSQRMDPGVILHNFHLV
jgi:hypothetical protein